MPEITTREAAHVQGLKRYFTGESCAHGHVAERYVSTGGCTACLHRYRANYASPVISRELVAWTPTQRIQIPVGLSLEQQTHLELTLQHWVITWAQQQGVTMSEAAQGTIAKAVQYRMDKLAKGFVE